MKKFEKTNWRQFAKFLTILLGSNYEIALYVDSENPNNELQNIFQTKKYKNTISKATLNKIKKEALKNAQSYKVITDKSKKLTTFIFFIKNDKQKIDGLLSINYHASNDMVAVDKLIKSLNLQNFFQESTKRSQQNSFSDSIEDVIYNVINPQYLDSKMILTPEQKKTIITKLYEENIFSRRGAVSTVAKILRMSIPTVYSYLRKIKTDE